MRGRFEPQDHLLGARCQPCGDRALLRGSHRPGENHRCVGWQDRPDRVEPAGRDGTPGPQTVQRAGDQAQDPPDDPGDDALLEGAEQAAVAGEAGDQADGKTQVKSIYRKLGVSSRGEAVQHATTVGLLGA